MAKAYGDPDRYDGSYDPGATHVCLVSRSGEVRGSAGGELNLLRTLKLYVTNDPHEIWEGTIRWSLETLRGDVLAAGQEQVKTAPLASTHVRTLDFADRISEDNRRGLILSLSCGRRIGASRCKWRRLSPPSTSHLLSRSSRRLYAVSKAG
jgi:hypothetical protein